MPRSGSWDQQREHVLGSLDTLTRATAKADSRFNDFRLELGAKVERVKGELEADVKSVAVDLRGIRDDLTKIQVALAQLQTRASMAGAITGSVVGLLTAVGASLVRSLWG